MAYFVVREWTSDLDRNGTTWYTLFVSFHQKIAEEFLENIHNGFQTDLHLCAIPIDTELDIVSWNKYIIYSRKWKSDSENRYRKYDYNSD